MYLTNLVRLDHAAQHIKRFAWTAAMLIVPIAMPGCSHQSSGEAAQAVAASKGDVPSKLARASKPRVLTRVFFQDYESKAMKWADVLLGTSVTLGPVSEVEGFPQLDREQHQFVQMETSNGLLLVGVREAHDKRHANGWVLIDTGVTQEDHGDHSHWKYSRQPSVRACQLDDQQGNPAHVYQYDGVFYLANDESSGYTRLDPSLITADDDEEAIRAKAAFHQGGGHHITLAVVEDRVGYSAWIDGGGPNKGRIDVTPIRPEGNTAIAYSFHLPLGAIHGATCCQNKVFFAPSDGVCWVMADVSAQTDPNAVEIHHVSLGKAEAADKPYRTGAFTTFGNYVLCTSGNGPEAVLNILNAGEEPPVLTQIPLDMQTGNRPVTPEVVATHTGKRYALVFHDHEQDVEAEDRLSILDLDPNGDGDFTDAKLAKSLEVGPSRVEGHYGHHSVTFDADGRRAYFTNPGPARSSCLT